MLQLHFFCVGVERLTTNNHKNVIINEKTKKQQQKQTFDINCNCVLSYLTGNLSHAKIYFISSVHFQFCFYHILFK